MSKFVLTINLGNAAMDDPDAIARALRNVADRMEASALESGLVWDDNGNRVGTFAVKA